MHLIRPEWNAPACVHAAMTTRHGGVSKAPFDSLNLGYATADDRAAVVRNEELVAATLGVATRSLRWVYQVHGVAVQHAERLPENAPPGATTIQADAVVSHTPGLVCGIKVADCMPVLFTSRKGDVVAAAHAGWRGLAGGVVENTLAAMDVPADQVAVWLGPCIGPQSFEVGEDVRDAFMREHASDADYFEALPQAGKFLCNLPAIARARLVRAGIAAVGASNRCTLREADSFFSHRRDQITGRMAAFVWIDAAR